MFSSQGTVNITENANLNIEFVRIDGAEGIILATTQDFTQKDNQRLEDLKAKYINK